MVFNANKMIGFTLKVKLSLLNTGRLAQLVRVLARHARSHWFESSIAHDYYE